MICSNCGKECKAIYNEPHDKKYPDKVSDCCGAYLYEYALVGATKEEKKPHTDCPCESESTEDCKSCQDRRTVEDVKSGLFTLDAVKEAMSKVGIIGYVRDRIIEELVK